MSSLIPAVTDTPVVNEEYANSRKVRGKINWRDVGLGLLLVGPNLILLAIFTYRPLIDNIRLSFYHWNISSPNQTFIGLDNYIEWFTSPDTGRVVFNTVVFTLAAVVGSMIIGLALALLLDQKLFGRGAVRSIVFAPCVISGAAIGVAFQFVFDPQYWACPQVVDR